MAQGTRLGLVLAIVSVALVGTTSSAGAASDLLSTMPDIGSPGFSGEGSLGGHGMPNGPRSAAGADARAGGVPLQFVPNRGQSSTEVRFEAHAADLGIYFTGRSAVLSLPRRGHSGYALGLRFLDARRAPRLLGETRTGARFNFLRGRDPRHWRRNLPGYEAVRYRSLWPGVDLRFRGGRGSLKYELRLAPGASAQRPTLAYTGARGLLLDRAGNLVIRTGRGVVRDAHPVAYQRIGGRRKPVAARFVLHGGNAYGFALGAYDHARPLVIDPGLAYSTFLGQASESDGVAADAAGSAYVVGTAFAGGFPTTTGAFDTTGHAGQEAYVAKLSPDGSSLAYATYLGGTGNDVGYGIAVDSSGAAYVTGSTASSDFPATTGAYDTTYNGGGDAFVSKLRPDGSSLVYSTFLGGAAPDVGRTITVDADGNAYAGGTAASGFPTAGFGAQPIYGGGSSDGFVTKITADGSNVDYSTFLGGSASDSVAGVAVRSGEAYATGDTFSTGFPTTPGALAVTRPGGDDAFVSKLHTSGDFAYSTYLGGGGSDLGNSIAVDTAGRAYLAGDNFGGGFPVTAGAYDQTYNGDEDGFVSRLNATGSALDWSTYLGTTNYEDAWGVALQAGKPVVQGDTLSSSFPTTTEAFASSSGGSQDVFVTRLLADGSNIDYSTLLGGSGDELFSRPGLALDGHGYAYVAGSTTSNDYPTTAGAVDTVFNPTRDAFVTKLPLPSVHLVVSSYTVNEFESSIDVTVQRLGEARLQATVDYTTSDATAKAGFDYQTKSGTLTFAVGETSKTVSVPIINDNREEPDESFGFALSNPSAGTDLVEFGNAQVKIVDDDDNTAPQTMIALGPGDPDPNGTFGGPVDLKVSATDNKPGQIETRCVLDPAAPPAAFADMPAGCPYLSGGTVSSLGPHTIYAASRDAAGNVESPPVSRSFRVTPDTVITSPPLGRTWLASAELAFISPTPGATFECRLDDGAFAACTSPFSTGRLSSGPHTFAVRAVGPDGFPDPTPAEQSWLINSIVHEQLTCDVRPVLPDNRSGGHFVGYGGFMHFPRRWNSLKETDLQSKCYIARKPGCPTGKTCRTPDGCPLLANCTWTDLVCPTGARCTLSTTARWSDADERVYYQIWAEADIGYLWGERDVVDSDDCSTGDGAGCTARSRPTSVLGDDRPVFGYCGIASVGSDDDMVIGPDDERRLHCTLEVRIFPTAPLDTTATGGSNVLLLVASAGVLDVTTTIVGGRAAGVRAAAAPRIAHIHKRVKRAGNVHLKLKLNRKARRLLRRRGSLKVKMRAKFKPTGGSMLTRTTRLTLRRAAKKAPCARRAPRAGARTVRAEC